MCPQASSSRRSEGMSRQPHCWSSGDREDNRPSGAPVLLARHVPRDRPVRPELPVLPTVQDAAAATAGENVPDTKPAAMGDSPHRPGEPSPPLQPRQLLRRRHAGPVHQVGAVPCRPKSHRPCGHSGALRGGHHPIRMSSDGDLGQWDTILRRNLSHPPPGTWDCTSADTAIYAPG
jgi:hypothetical protein